ncbi:MAG TPA: sugar nucleotide-binding protein [Stellaceae bacterium]|nr:sugar nucleotide-binding protein [Stellaceae bacterium]
MTGRLLLIGGDSEIAAAALAAMRGAGLPAVATTRRRDRLADDRVFHDLAPPLGDWQPPDGVEAACIFAAVGNLVDCQRDPAGSALINVTRSIELAERLVERGIYVLFLSTDKVFDGARPLMPADAPLAPISEYGRQKALTDAHFQAMIAAGFPVGILRLAKIFSPGIGLFNQWRRALAAGEPVRAFRDMMVAPTLAEDVAAAIVALLGERAAAVWQLSGARDLPYAEAAAYIAQRVGADPAFIEPVAAASAAMPAGATPPHTTLDSSALAARFGIRPREPWPVIDAVIAAP